MYLPITLTLVRHGQSEGNVVIAKSLAGDDSGFTPEFCAMHSSRWLLTKQGQDEARAAGAWLRDQYLGGVPFDRFVTSEYYRASETAGLLGLDSAHWETRSWLRERHWGHLDGVPIAKQMVRYRRSIKRRTNDPFWWQPPDGESMADIVETRVLHALHLLRESAPSERAIMVLHEEVMWAFRYHIEYQTVARWTKKFRSEKPENRIHNCQIIQYTRRNPEDASDVREAYCWVRSVCPWDLTLSSNVWQRFTPRRTFSNRELLIHVELVRGTRKMSPMVYIKIEPVVKRRR